MAAGGLEGEEGDGRTRKRETTVGAAHDFRRHIGYENKFRNARQTEEAGHHAKNADFCSIAQHHADRIVNTMVQQAARKVKLIQWAQERVRGSMHR
jgi:hypothetical protein